MWDVVDCVLLAVSRPVVQEVVDVHFELLKLILLHVSDVVLQLLQCGQLRVRHHAPLLVKAPQDAGHQTATKKKKKNNNNEDENVGVTMKSHTYYYNELDKKNCCIICK